MIKNPSLHPILKELKSSYNRIAKPFSQSRMRPWPGFSWLKKHLIPESKVLDLGCGNGRLYESIKPHIKSYTGVDFAEDLLHFAKKRYPNLPFIQADICQLHLEERFNTICSIAVIHHMPTPGLRKEFLKTVFDHLEDQGVFIASTWNLWQRKYLKHHLKANWKYIWNLFRHWEKTDARGLNIPFGKNKIPRYYHAFSYSELTKLLIQNGFEVIEMTTISNNIWFAARKKVLLANTLEIPVSPIISGSALTRPTPSPCHHESIS